MKNHKMMMMIITTKSGDENDKELENEKKNDDGVFKVPTIPSASRKSKRDQPIARAPSVLSSQDDIERYRALLLDFNDDHKTDRKPKKKVTNFFDEEHSDNEDSNQGIINDDDDDDDSDIDMEITWQPGLKSKAEQKFKNSNDQTEKKKNKK